MFRPASRFYSLLISLLVLISACTQPEPIIKPPTQVSGLGLSAEYFARSDFSGPKVRQLDRHLHFYWGAIAPTKGLPPGDFSARWQADLRVSESNDYRFFLAANGQVSLKIAGKAVQDGDHLHLEAGKSYPLLLEFVRTNSDASLKLEWQAAGGERTVIGQEFFHTVNDARSDLTLTVTLGSNLLLNSDFEGGTGGWLKYGGEYQTVQPGRSSTRALSASAWAWIQQDLPVSSLEAGQTYTLSGYARALNGATCSLGVAGGIPGQRVFNEVLTFRSADWQQQALSVTLPAGTAWTAVYMASTQTECLFDDLSLIAGTTVSPPPPVETDAIINGEFSDGLANWGRFGGNASIVSPGWDGSGTALQVTDFGWIQQDIPGSVLLANESYTLSAYGRSSSSAACTVGLVAATATEVILNETLSYAGTSWQQQNKPIVLPSGISWAAVYLAGNAGNCFFDNISLALPVPQGTGTGLLGEYYNRLGFTGTRLTRLDPVIDFNWGTASPLAGIPVDRFTVRWRGQIEARYTGSYTFFTTSDDGVRLWVNNRLIIDNWTVHAPTVDQGSITLQAGQKVDIRLDYYENTGGAVIKLEWQSARQAREVVPASQLYPANPSVAAYTQGQWSSVRSWPLIATHMANLPDGRILAWASYDADRFGGRPQLERTRATIYDPVTDSFTQVDNLNHDMFCAGLGMLADGRIFAAGGGDGANSKYFSFFDNATNTWSQGASLQRDRWYNTAVAMPDGSVYTAMGRGAGLRDSEIWDGRNWRILSGFNFNDTAAQSGRNPNWYPYMHLSPRGTILWTGRTNLMAELDVTGNGSRSNLGQRLPNDVFREWASAIMIDEGLVLMTGGTPNPNSPGSVNSAMLIDMNAAQPVVTPISPMNFRRTFHSTVILPNQDALVLGGNTSGVEFSDSGTIYTPELYLRSQNTWVNWADMAVPRNYHSTAALLPDARILIAGGGLCGSCSANHQNGQIFTPPYLFNPDGSLAARPVIQSAPSSLSYNQPFTVTMSGSGADAISKFTLIKLSATTHGMNTDLRALDLSFSRSGNTYSMRTHSNNNVLTPGYYFLFAVNDQGVPSVAQTINVQ